MGFNKVPATLSIIILTKDEEKMIGGCLQSAVWADEIIVVDSLSQDRTVEIAREYTDKLYLPKFDRTHVQNADLTI